MMQCLLLFISKEFLSYLKSPPSFFSTNLELRGETGDGVFWKAISHFLISFIGSILIGMVLGIITAYVI